MKMKSRVYLPSSIGRADLEIIRTISLLAELRQINLPLRRGYSYALYEKFSGGKIDHRFYPTITKSIPEISGDESIEIFVYSPSGVTTRIVVRVHEEFVVLPSGELLRYEFKLGDVGNKTLVVYFDYSRLTSKIALTQEYLPRFGFSTPASIMKISNTLGFWGTACLFDSKGNLILDFVSNLINKISNQYGFDQIFMIGGSQGATACIVYSEIVKSVRVAYCACPVKISKKNMLFHLAEDINEGDFNIVSDIFSSAINSKKVRLFTTIGDTSHFSFHNSIVSLGSVESFHVCGDSNIAHGDCLKYFIKKIYIDINERIESSSPSAVKTTPG